MSDFITNPNQRDICVNKLKVDKEDYYTRFRLDALQLAMKTLTPKAFEMWCYLGKNKDNYKLYLSKVDCLQWCNFAESSYQKAFKELVDNKYLIPKDKDSIEPKHYDFYELPQDDKEPTEITVHKAVEDNKEVHFVF